MTPRNSAAAAAAAAAMALNLDSILVGAFHGNSDNVYAMFGLLAAYCMIDLDSPLLSGLAFAAAINIKLLPLVLFFPLLAMCSTRERLLRYLCGVAIGLIPFIVAIPVIRRPFITNVIGYHPIAARWGTLYVLSAFRHSGLNAIAGPATEFLRRFGSYLVLAVVAAMSFAARRFARDRRNAYGLAAMSFAVLLILAPGFGVQYTVAIVPILIAWDARRGFIYGTLAGLFVGVTYWMLRSRLWPFTSDFSHSGFPQSAAIVGLIPWLYLVYLLWTVLFDVRRAANASITDR